MFDFIKICIKTSDWYASKINSVLKLIYFWLAAPVFEYGYVSGSRFLLCPKKSYLKKKFIYESIAENLDASIIVVSFSIYKRRRDLLLHQKNCEYFFWSGAQIRVIFLAKYLSVKINKMIVYQHGGFPLDGKFIPKSIMAEWKYFNGHKYYAWTRQDGELFGSFNKDVSVNIIGQPLERARVVKEGISFGTRGPEYFINDLKIIRKFKLVNFDIYFHPAYGEIKKLFFCFFIFLQGVKFFIGNNLYISEKVITASRSFFAISEKSNVLVHFIEE